MQRRGFLKLLAAFFTSILSGSFLYSFLRYLAPPSKSSEASKIIVAKAEVAEGQAKEIIINNTPAIVINRPGKGYIVLSRVCTHLGCLVKYEPDRSRLFCPCHAGVYNLDGKVISGPPPKPLPKFPFRVEGENIVIG